MWENILASSLVIIVFIIVILLIAYIISARNMSKQKKHFEYIHETLSVGQQIVFSNGIYGTIKKIQDKTVDVELKSGAILTVSRFAISEIIK